MAVLVCAAVAAPAVWAAYSFQGSFSGPGAGDGQLDAPGRVAVEQSTGNLFVVDSGNDRVQVFAPAADGGEYLTQFGVGVLESPHGIAVDSVGGQTVVYVADAGNGRIAKFQSDEAATPSFTVDAGYTTPAAGTGADQVADFRAALALAPNGDLWVADPGSNAVKRFDPTGAHVAGSNFDGSTSGTAFEGLLDVATSTAGDVYVVDSNGDIANQLGTSRVERFAADGSHLATLGPVGANQRPATVAVDPDSGDVAVSGEQDAVYRDQTPTLHIFDATNAAVEEFVLDQTVIYDVVTGVAFHAAAGQVYVVAGQGHYFGTPYGEPKILVYQRITPPTVTANAVDPGAVTATAATLAGAVNPNGLPTDWRVEYRSVGAADWKATTPESVGDGTAPVDVEAQIAGLMAATDYEWRLVATNADGSATSGIETFSTPVGPPVAETYAAQRTTTSVVINGGVHPGGLPTTYYFEYGPDTNYGTSIPASRDASAGQGAAVVAFSRTLTGLQPGTTYHYRLVAQNAEGQSAGPDRTVATLATPPPGRAYEMVSPPQKNGGNVFEITGAASGGLISPDGNRVAFMSSTAFADAPSGGLNVSYVATRGDDRWSTTAVHLPFDSVFRPGGDGPQISASTPDLSKAIIETNVDPATRVRQPRRNLYLRDNVTGSVTQITPDPVAGPLGYLPARGDGRNALRATSASLGHALLGTSAELTADAVGLGGEKLYVVDTASREIELVSVDPAGDPFGGEFGSAGVKEDFAHNEHILSDDGNVVYFQTDLAGAQPLAGPLYRRDLAAGQTVAVNAAEGTAAPLDAAAFMDASADGRYVFFSTDQDLVPEDVNGGGDVYRYDAAAPVGSRLTLVSVDEEPADGTAGPGTSGESVRSIGVSESGDRLYFISDGHQLVADAPTAPAQARLFLWEDGELYYVATDPGLPDLLNSYATNRPIRARWRRLTPRGDKLVIEGFGGCVSGESPPCTTGHKSQVYLYDRTDSTPAAPDFACVSCLPGGPEATPWTGTLEWFEIGDTAWKRHAAVSDDGTVVFSTPTPLTPDDVNGPGKDYVPSPGFGGEPAKRSESSDVYAYKDGDLELISAGASEHSSFAYGISADGATIAFATRDQLSGWDVDGAYDVYVARRGGGLPEPPPAPPGCLGDECQERPSGRPDSVTPGSRLVRGSERGRVAARASLSLLAVRQAQRRRFARTGTVVLRVRVSRAGRARAVARARIGRRMRIVGRGSAIARRRGVVRVRVRLSRAARTRLARRERLALRVTARFADQRRMQRLNLRRSK